MVLRLFWLCLWRCFQVRLILKSADLSNAVYSLWRGGLVRWLESWIGRRPPFPSRGIPPQTWLHHGLCPVSPACGLGPGRQIWVLPASVTTRDGSFARSFSVCSHILSVLFLWRTPTNPALAVCHFTVPSLSVCVPVFLHTSDGAWFVRAVSSRRGGAGPPWQTPGAFSRASACHFENLRALKNIAYASGIAVRAGEGGQRWGLSSRDKVVRVGLIFRTWVHIPDPQVTGLCTLLLFSPSQTLMEK